MYSEQIDYSYEYIYNRVKEEIKRYEIDNDVSVLNISQLQYYAVLMYLHDTVIKPMNIDIRNTFILSVIVDVLKRISYEYNKTISLYAFSLLMDINYNTVKSWNNRNNNQNIYIDKTTNKVIEYSSISFYRYHYPDHEYITVPNTTYYQLCKRILSEREQNLTAKAENGSVMSLALGKIQFGWIEGKDKQLQAEIMQQTYSLPDDILNKYE